MNVFDFFGNYNNGENFEVSLFDANSDEETCTTVDKIHSNKAKYVKYNIQDWNICANVINLTVIKDVSYNAYCDDIDGKYKFFSVSDLSSEQLELFKEYVHSEKEMDENCEEEVAYDCFKKSMEKFEEAEEKIYNLSCDLFEQMNNVKTENLDDIDAVYIRLAICRAEVIAYIYNND